MSFFLSGYLKRDVGELRWPGVHSNGDTVITSLLVFWCSLIVYSLLLSYINSTLPKPLEIALTALTIELFASTIGTKGINLLSVISLCGGAGNKMYQNKVEGFKKIHHKNKCSLSLSYSLWSVYGTIQFAGETDTQKRKKIKELLIPKLYSRTHSLNLSLIGTRFSAFHCCLSRVVTDFCSL